MFIIVMTVVLLTFAGESNQSKDLSQSSKFVQKISDCHYLGNSTRSVELICNNVDDSYVSDNCFSSLFTNSSNMRGRSKVKFLKTGKCRSTKFDSSLAEMFPNLLSLDIASLGYTTTPAEESLIAKNFNIPKLKKLNASFNEISLIGDMFNNMEDVNEIDLSHNRISSIFEESFEITNNIKILNFSHNSIVSLEVSSFENLGKLLIIDLSDNLLETFDMYLFIRNVRLQEIHLENNRIKTLLFSNNFMPIYDTLTFFSAAGNQIDNFNEIVIQCLGTKLQVLDLSGNSLGNINSTMFEGLNDLQRLNFSHTNITKFNFNAFEHPEKMISIDLSYNRLNELNLNLTTNFEDLKELYLQENDLDVLKNITNFTFPMMNRLGISRNWLNCNYATEFVHQWKDIQIIGDPCDQKTNMKNESTIFYVIFVPTIVLFGAVVIGIWFNIRRKNSSKNQQNNDQTTPRAPEHLVQWHAERMQRPKENEQSDRSSWTPYEVCHIYEEINPVPVEYDHLNHNPQPSTNILPHYDNFKTLNRNENAIKPQST